MSTTLDETQHELEDLARTRQAMERQASEPIPLEHLPTPLAKTVFGKEIHYRLQGGRLAYVPLDEFVDLLSNEWQQKVWKLKENPESTETLGPLHGFRLRYTIVKEVAAVDSERGPRAQQIVQVAGFVLQPVRQDLGVPFEEAMIPGSEFRQSMASYDPQRTTVTIWTYPDSYQQFRTLKEQLYELGFLAAGRPMPAGYPIGGSPSGSRSSAQ